MIAAANEIDGKPYIWSGGHAGFLAKGYDCSGAVSYVLHGADLLGYTQVSGQLAHYGNPGPGRWITIYANPEHVFMGRSPLRHPQQPERHQRPPLEDGRPRIEHPPEVRRPPSGWPVAAQNKDGPGAKAPRPLSNFLHPDSDGAQPLSGG